MKVSVIITTLLVAQVSASFFDVFQGAVLSVQNSFGKLLSDVVTDVKETFDCTILAVEHVLSLSHDATTRYYHKCGSETNKTDSVSDARLDASLPKVEVTLNLPNNEEYLQKVIPAEIDARINETLSKVLGNFKPHDNILSTESVLAVLVKNELEKLSNEVSKDLKKMEKQRDSEGSVDTILQELKVLEKREQNSKNSSEANEIHLVIDQVLGKLDEIEATEAMENFKLEEILKDLESNSNNNLVGLRHQFEEWKEQESRHLSEIKSKIEAHEKLTDHPGPYNRHETNYTQPVIFNTNTNKDNVETNENSQDISSYNTTRVKETLDNSTSTRTIGAIALLVVNSSSSSQNYTFNELNDIVITSTSYSSIESPLESVMIHPFKNPNAYSLSELTTLSATIQNNVIRVNKNETVTNTTLEVIDSAPMNKTIQPVQSIPDSDKRQSLALNKPNFLLINENNSNKTVIISTKTLATTDTSSDAGKQESPNLAASNNLVITSAAQNTETVLSSITLESFKNENSKDSAKISKIAIASMMVENVSVNASNYENESVTTLDHIELTETMTPSIPTYLNVSTPVTETIISIESSTATINEESSTVTAKIVSDNDSNNTMLPSSSTILESTSIIKNVLLEETAVAFSGDHSTTELSMRNDVSKDNTLIMSPSVENSPVSETIEPEKTATAFGTENSLIFKTKIVDDNDSNDTMASTCLILESAPLSKSIQPEEIGTTANRESTETITESTITSTTRNGGDSNTTLISTPIPTISTSESQTIQATLSTSSTTSSVNKESATITTKIVNGNYLNNAMITTDPSSILDTTPVSKTIEPEEPIKASDKEKSSMDSTNVDETMTTTNTSYLFTSSTTSLVNYLNNAMIITDPSLILDTTPVSKTLQTEELTTASDKEKSTMDSTNVDETMTTTNTSYLFTSSTTSLVNYLNNAMIITDPSSILDTTPASKTLQTEEPTTASDKEEKSIDSNVTLKTTISSTMESTLVIETIQPEENSTSAGKYESTEAITESTSTSITVNDSETTITSTPITTIRTSTSKNETIQAVDTTTRSTSEEESLTSTANRLTETPNTVDVDEDNNNDDDDYSSTTVRMSTPEAISESISEENILAPDDEERLPSTTSPPKTSPAALMDTDSISDDIITLITSTPFPISEIITFTKDEEPSILSTSPAIVRDEVAMENNDLIVTVTSKTENRDSLVVTEIIQRVETTIAFEEQEFSSAMSKMVTSTVFLPTESIPTSESVMTSRNEEDLRKPARLEANTSRTPEVLNSPNLNLIVTHPPLTIAPPVNREWLTPNKLNQQNYNTNGEQRNNYEFNGSISLSDRLLQTRQLLFNPKVPKYGQAAMPPITRGLFNDAPKWLPPNRLIPDFPGQPPKIDNDVLQKAAFDIFDSAHERLSHSDSPFGPEKDIFRNIPLIPNTPREPMGPPRMSYENPSYVPPSQHPMHPPYSFDSDPENINRQHSLTTHRWARTPAHANNDKNPSFDYDSFFHLRDPEAHQRALKEARQLMANSKRSNDIINNIMKNKKKFNARPIFG